VHRPADTLSLTQKIKLNLARAAISDSPLILLDDVTDQLGADYIGQLLPELFFGRTVIVGTRQAKDTDALQLPVLLLHHGCLIHQGTIDEISLDLSCPRVVDVWVEGLRYDLLRQLRQHSGVLEARLIPSHQFVGQRLRITLFSARYLPAMYDLVSQAPLIKVAEIPPSLTDILPRLP
jgi:ABC-type multidrug transport system ATPase subunit